MIARRLHPVWPFTATFIVAVAVSACAAKGDVATLPSGIVIEGKAIPVHGLDQRSARHGAQGTLPEPWWVVDDGVRRYFLPARLTHLEPQEELSGTPEFTLPRTIRARTTTPDVIGSSIASPWDEYGRRTVTLKLARKPIDIQQEINRIRPDYVEVNGITHEWSHGLDTRLLPADILQSLLRRASNPRNLDDRKAIIRFYLDARNYELAESELKQLVSEHPELREWGEPQLPLIAEQKARAAIAEVQRRRRAGQHRLAYLIAAAAMKEESVPADALLQCQEMLAEYDTARENAGQVQMLLEQYEAELPGAEADLLRPLRPQLLRELQFESLGRLEPFLRARNDKGLTPSQKLALAYSGWVVGAAFADVDLKVAVNLWQARFIALEYLRTHDDPLQRDEFVQEIKALEGVTMERLAEMATLLPYVDEPMPPSPGEPRTYQLTLKDGLALRYAITLPHEYHPAHRYPAIIALRRSGQPLEEALRWWAGTAEAPGIAMNRGYIVIAPEFAAEQDSDYAYDADAHRRVIAALTDARRKFAIDSDRVFIAGHELGGEATFDLAIAHPDVFAGAAPFVAGLDRYPRVLSSNGANLGWYIVTGERHLPGGLKDPESIARSLGTINKLVVRDRADLTYVEYKGRGFESYHEELPRLFDWMDAHRRKSLRETRDEWKVEVLRSTGTRYYWLGVREVPAKLNDPINWSQPRLSVQPMTFSGKITLENTIYITVPATKAAAHADIWLSPAFFDFEKRLKVRVNRQNAAQVNALVQPEPGALLEDFRIRGDRQQLFWAKVEL